MAVATYTKAGTKATTPAKLDKAVFGVNARNHDLIKLAYTAHLAKRRQTGAITKTRGLVRGGGRKPWRQKGTGRARFGSIRNPIWRGGGIVFGPTGLENHTKNLSATQKRTAIKQALSLGAANNKLKIVESLNVLEGKTANMVAFLTKIDVQGRVLIVVDNHQPRKQDAVANLQTVKVITAAQLNVYDLINADNVIITKESLPLITAWLGSKQS